MKKYYLSALLVSVSISLATVSAQQVVDTDTSAGGSSCITINNNLSYKNRANNNKDDVMNLQDFLNGAGYLNTNSVTGFFGKLTEKAVAKFQKDNGLVANPPGFVGAGTRAKILALSCGGQTNTNTTNTSDANVNNNKPSSDKPNLPQGCKSTEGFSTLTGVRCSTIAGPGLLGVNSNKDFGSNKFKIETPVITLSASKTRLKDGETFDLIWESTGDVENCTLGLERLWGSAENVASSGRKTIIASSVGNFGTVDKSALYRLVCKNSNGQSIKTITLNLSKIDVQPTNAISQDVGNGGDVRGDIRANPGNCYIPNGSNSCQISLIWNSTNATNPHVNITSSGNTLLSSLSSSLGYDYYIKQGTTTFSFRDETHTFGEVSASTKCLPGADFDTNGYCNVIPALEKKMIVLNPNGGETWTLGQTNTVKWNSSGITTGGVDLYLKTEGGAMCSIGGLATLAIGEGEASIPLPVSLYCRGTSSYVTSGKYKVVVIANQGSTAPGYAVPDESDGYINLIAPQN